jgi:hypothetical protein
MDKRHALLVDAGSIEAVFFSVAFALHGLWLIESAGNRG